VQWFFFFRGPKGLLLSNYLSMLLFSWLKTKQQQKPTTANLWVPVGILLYALAWLIPLGVNPWSTFLRESSISGLSLLFGLILVLRMNGQFRLTQLALCAAALALMPLVQWGFGLIAVGGGAWITSAYLFGFALSIGCGALCDRADAGTMLNALFSAIGLAALATVCIQCHQWANPSDMAGLWVGYTLQTRLAGNFGQSNHTATFLLWGTCAATWLWIRGYGKGWLTVLVCAVFLTGVCFTVSRTAWLGLVFILGLCWYWRALWPDRRAPWIATALCVYFVAVSLFHPSNGAVEVLVSSSSGLARLQIWEVALKALVLQPWFGYGWGQIFTAQLAVAAESPQLHYPILSAHNLVLDVLLSCGVLIGGFAICAGALWLWRCVRAVSRPQEALMLIFIAVALNHAMLEFPLHYAYMLLPFGLVLGALDVRLSPWKLPTLQVSKMACLSALALAALLWLLIVKDYFNYQDSYQDLVLHRVGVVTEPWQAPKAILLDQLGARLELEELDINRKDRSTKELAYFESVAALTPAGGAQLLLAGSLAMHGKPERAQWWLASFCGVYSEKACATARANWKAVGEKYPEIGAVTWPVNDKTH
jgi:O-antigen ligase